MNTATRSRIRQFGTGAAEARVAARYANFDAAEMHRVQVASNRTRQEATMSAQDGPNKGTIETLHELAASRTPWISRDKVALFAATNTAEVVAQRIDWLEKQPVAKVHEPAVENSYWKGQAAQREAAQEREAYEGKMRRDSQQEAAEVPEGRYAIKGEDHVVRFYKVDRPTEGRWAGYVFVKIQASDELHNLRSKASREDVLRRIAEAGVEESMRLYGLELGKCGHCGRTLTDEESRAYGIGPKCRAKMGF